MNNFLITAEAVVPILAVCAFVGLAAWSFVTGSPWGALADLFDRIARRRAANRRTRQIAEAVWARHEAEKREAEMWRRVQRGVVERLKVEATEVER